MKQRFVWFLLATALLALLLFTIPQVAALAGVREVLQSGARKGVDPAALFYTETGEPNEAAAWWRDTHIGQGAGSRLAPGDDKSEAP
ncbi:MAG TPA: hypothetical protein VNJ47_10680 [Nevskiales bacterium]|nr:hypothetical protein [Nevskiales bacterium]